MVHRAGMVFVSSQASDSVSTAVGTLIIYYFDRLMHLMIKHFVQDKLARVT